MSDTMLIAGAARSVVYVDPTGRTPGTYPSYTFADGDSNYDGTYDYTGERRDEEYNEWSYQYWTGGNGKYLVKSGSVWYLFSSLPSYNPEYSEPAYTYSGSAPATGNWSGYYGDEASFIVSSSWGDAGDGSTPALALSDLPAALADNTVYLVRRCNGAATLKNATYTGSAICLVGMPKSTDPDFGNAPLAAQQAWGSDTADYAMVQCPATRGVEASALSYLVLSRIYLMREAGSSACTSHCFYVSSTSVPAAVSASRCRFGVYGWDFDDSQYTGTPKYRAHGYICVNHCASFSMSDSTVIWTPYQDSDPAHAFNVSVRARGCSVYLRNIAVWSSLNPDHHDGVPKCFSIERYAGSNPYALETLDVENLAVTFIHMGETEYVPQILYAPGYTCYARLHGITVGVASRDNGIDLDDVDCEFEGSNGGNRSWSMFYLGSTAEYDIEGISVILPRIRCGYCATGLFHLADGDCEGVPGYARSVKDVDIALCALDEDPLDSNSSAIYSRINTDSTSRLHGAAFMLCVANYGEDHPAMVSDIHVSNPKGFAAEVNCNISDCTMKGHVRLLGAVADIDSIVCDFPGRAICLVSGSNAHVGTITLDKTAGKCTEYGGATGDYAAVTAPENGTTLVVGSCNADLCSLSGSSSGDTSENQNIYCCNSARAQGRYTCRSKNMTAEAWSIYRTGGAEASVKVTGVVAGCIPWGRPPFKGFQATPASTGNKTVTIYLAHKGMSGTPQGNVKVLLLVPNADGSTTVVDADAVSAWQQDSGSTWNGETGLTCYKLSVPVSVGAKAPVEAKVFWKWYTASAYAYLDPKLEIV